MNRAFAYRKLQIAFDAFRAGARFFATNGDRYCPVPPAFSGGPVGGEPDATAIVAAFGASTNTHIEAIVSKPNIG